MHESLMARQIVEAVSSEAARRGATGVRFVDVDVGALEGIRAEDLQAAFDVAAVGTNAEGARLRVAVAAVRGFCPVCLRTRTVRAPEEHRHEPPGLACPACGAPLETEGGRGFVIRSASLVLDGR